MNQKKVTNVKFTCKGLHPSFTRAHLVWVCDARTPMEAMVMVKWESKSNKEGKLEYATVTRHKDAAVCAFSNYAMHQIMR